MSISQPDFELNPQGAGSRKRAAQFDNWGKILPELVQIYLKLLQDTSSLCTMSGLRIEEGDPCGCVKRTLNITVIRWHDVRLLDFVAELSLNVSPNNTAFCKALETSLANRGFKLERGQHLRIRFGNAHQWFTQVVVLSRKLVDNSLKAARTAAWDEYERGQRPVPRYLTPTQPCLPPPEIHSSPDIHATPDTRTGQKRCCPSSDSDEHTHAPPPNPFPEPPPRTRPSDYLIEKCPPCFAGLVHDPTQVYNFAACIDGNFTQKRRKQRSGDNPPKTHPNSVFIPHSTAQQMEAHVDGVRSTQGKRNKKARVEPDLEDHGYEGPLKVPRSGLDACEASFKAADESREKASTKFFAQTGLMALVCRHDIVLFLVNMETAGEKQYYALLLLEMIFQHLPRDIVLGCLYDIACHTHRSCVKWDFLDCYKDRIAWAVSVFHAFAHIWACQLIYHPQKCIGFGEENGECAERVWFSLSHLIAFLHVCGLEHNGKNTVVGMAAWLLRRSLHCEASLREAEEVLHQSELSEGELQTEWDAQVKFQTRPLAHSSYDSYQLGPRRQPYDPDNREQNRVPGAELSLPSLAVDSKLAQQERLQELEAALAKEKLARTKTMRQLGAADQRSLQKLELRDYYSAKLSARTLKEHIMHKLTQRKMELDPIERSVHQSSSARKKNEHAAAAIKKREPTIKKLVKNFNAEQAKIVKLIKQKKAPAGVVAPQQLNEAHIFDLDIDDCIWLDVGLTDDDSAAIPNALLDPELRKCIRALLQKRRCEEESHRLSREHRHLHIWFATEWTAVQQAIQGCTDGPLTYQLRRRKQDLLTLYLTWTPSLDVLVTPANVPVWGPLADKILQARLAQVAPVGTELDVDAASDVDSDEGAEEEEDPALISVLSTIEQADHARQPQDNEEDDWENDNDFFTR
ncbi:hypothetical protein C8F01DRAFT_1092378 [Mycena amicta]|nr:hypothetical protein C8F01DRAFT_1092378 [Mycena amicta]